RLVMILVKIFASQLIRDIGRQFFRVVSCPFFGSTRIQISCHDLGKRPSCRA
ncbi:hypothetical protein BC941DRAFT_356858, partial [Chlamydoabsidia padenii]